MSEEAIKKRLKYATKKAIEILEASGYQILPSNSQYISFIADREAESRVIKIVLDKITNSDRKSLENFELSDKYKKEIWCAKRNIFRKIVFKKEDIS